MAKANDVGVYQLDNGMWGFRFVMVVDGKQISQRRTTDELGNKLKIKNQAIKARQTAMVQARTGRKKKQEIPRRTVKEVFDEFCASGRKDRAY